MTNFENRTAPAAGLTAAEPFVSAHGRATLVILLFLGFIAVSLFSVISNLLQINLLTDALGVGGVSQEDAEMNDLRQQAVAVMHFLVYLAFFVAFLLWLYRANKNLAALGNPPSRIEFTPGWAVGWFFIPLAQFYMPYKAVREVWEKSDPAIKTEDDFMFTPTGSSVLLPVWWVSWIVMSLLGRASWSLQSGAKSIDSIVWVTWVDVVGDAIGIASAVLSILVVRSIDRRQAERAAHVTYVPNMPPPPPLFTTPPPPPQQQQQGA